MKVTKCANGHFFDADKSKFCPHCGATVNDENKSTEKPNRPDVVMGMMKTTKPVLRGNIICNDKFISEDPIDTDTVILGIDEYVMLPPDVTVQLYCDILRLTIESSGDTKEFNKQEVNVGRDPSNDYHLAGKTYVARRQATFFYENKIWFLRDNYSTNGTYINGKRLESGKKYQLAPNDVISFAKQDTVIFEKSSNNEQTKENPEEKTLLLLEAGMTAFAKSGDKDDSSFKIIIAALTEAPLYFPIEIDVGAMFGNIDPTKLKAGDAIQSEKDVRMRILTLCPAGGIEHVAMFTSNEEANKGPSASIVRIHPQDYLPQLIEMDMPVIINPFSESRFLLSKQVMVDVIWPAVQRKTNDNVLKQTENITSNRVVDNQFTGECSSPKKNFLQKLFSKKDDGWDVIHRLAAKEIKKLGNKRCIFKSDCIIEVTNFDAKDPTDSLGYICSANILMFSNGMISVVGDGGEERFHISSVINFIDNIGNYDPSHENEVKFILNNKSIVISFYNKDKLVKKELMDKLKQIIPEKK